MFFQPVSNDVAMMNFQVVNNQKDFLVSIFNQPIHKLDQRLGIHFVFVNHEAYFSLIGDRRNQIDSFASRMKLDFGCLSTGSITSPMVAIVTQPCLIAPMNFCAFYFCSLGNFRVFVIQPGFHSLGILFVSFFQGLLRRKTPSIQVLADGPNRHIQGPQLLDELLNSDACPQCKSKFHLIRAFVPYCFLQFFFLLFCQCAAASLWTAAFFDRYSWFTASKIGFVPFAGGSSMNPGNLGNFLVSSSGFFKSYRLIPELLLGLCAKLSCIDFFHTKLHSTV